MARGCGNLNQILCCRCVVCLVKQDGPALLAGVQVTRQPQPVSSTQRGLGLTCRPSQGEEKRTWEGGSLPGLASEQTPPTQPTKQQVASDPEKQEEGAGPLPGVCCVTGVLSNRNREPSHPSSHPP